METLLCFVVVAATIIYVYHRLNTTYIGPELNNKYEEAEKSFLRGDGYAIGDD